MTPPDSKQRVVYLFGAGATHACAQAVSSSISTLMRDLGLELVQELKARVSAAYTAEEALSLAPLLNDVIGDDTDFEHIITFLDQSCSELHRRLAGDMRNIFENVLRSRLKSIEAEQGRVPDDLYDQLLDMYEVPNFPEQLQGVLTINYDDYLESAVAKLPNRSVDAGVSIGGGVSSTACVKILKLHGSFSWNETWPITTASGAGKLWIPPGIQKAKERYPFNILWGLARELLDCDVLRIVGCRLGANDWDLISLLFTTRLAAEGRTAYQIEIIDSPLRARQLKDAFPYLGVRSILEVEPVGSQLIAELAGGKPREFGALSETEQAALEDGSSGKVNWFRLWLKHKAEAAFNHLGSVATERGVFERLLEAY